MGWKVVIGIEGDAELARHAKANFVKLTTLSKSRQTRIVYHKDFTDINEILDDLDERGISIPHVYAFNPCEPDLLIRTLALILTRLPDGDFLTVQLRNPVASQAVLESLDFTACSMLQRENTEVLILNSKRSRV